jgi:hypothetical protein
VADGGEVAGDGAVHAPHRGGRPAEDALALFRRLGQ